MANRAYVSLWTRDHSEAMMLDRFERLLETVPVSETRASIANLAVRAVGPEETALFEQSFGGAPVSAADVIGLAREYVNADSAYEVELYWDVWQWDIAVSRWQRTPDKLLVTCYGEIYDDGVAAGSGDFLIDAGLEHLYTGHGGLLGTRGVRTEPSDAIEAEFLAMMSFEDNLELYYQKTRENIQQLLNWVGAIEGAMPIDHYQLWSEGEDNLEARLDEILAVH